MADTYSIQGSTYTIRSWDGGRLNTKAHGPGTLVHTDGFTNHCTLNQGVISGYCWGTNTSGDKDAEVYNTQGMWHGTHVVFPTSGHIILAVYNNGKKEGSYFKGMTLTNYI